MTTPEVKQHWEERYAERDRIWSGRVNRWLAEVADMRGRLNEVRAAIASHDNIGPVNLKAVGRQKGMFSTLKLKKQIN